MNHPRRFTIFTRETGEQTEQDYMPASHYLNNPDYLVLYDTRYEAKMRLFKYWQKLNGCEDVTYKPFANTEIGRTISILNF